ncbi:MAG: galactokinase, partial [Cyclobacteriaceae bacterium]
MSTEHELASHVKKVFIEQFGQNPILIKAPGRINIIGEHTDYNNGFVLPAATNQAIYIAIAKAENSHSTLISLDLNQTHIFDINELVISKNKLWANYILGVLAEVKNAGHKLHNIHMVFSGDVPRGSGMSSSAALECGTCFGINEIFDLKINKLDMVKMSQMAEHNFVGVMCGIMDQFASTMGKQSHAMLLDCKTLDYNYFPISMEDYMIVLCNSNVSHSLADSEYNTRRLQCEDGVKKLKRFYPEIKSLRDVSLDQLKDKKSALSEVVFKRCKYIIEENVRVLAMTRAMEKADFEM